MLFRLKRLLQIIVKCIVRKCLKFLISINFFFCKKYYINNIRLPHRIRKVVKNIFINIIGYERKKL